MIYAFALQNMCKRHKKNLHIKQKGLSVQILLFIGHFLFQGNFVSAIDLCPARDAGLELVDTRFHAHFHKVVLIVQGLTRSHKNHFALDNIN